MDNQQGQILKAAKAIALFFVVLGHTMIPSIRNDNNIVFYIWSVIYIFHMPLFFFASGVLFELNICRYLKNKKTFVKNKFKMLIVPYISLSCVIYLLVALLSLVPNINKLMAGYGYSIGSLAEAVYEICTYQNHLAQHLWFVLVLFIIFLISILPLSEKKLFCILMVVLPLIALPLIKTVLVLPDIIEYTLFEIPFFMLGRLTAKNKVMICRILSVNFAPILFAVFVFLYFIGVNQLDPLNPLKWIFMLCMRSLGIAATFSIAAIIIKAQPISRILMYLDDKSYTIYLLHQPFLVSGAAGVLYACHIPVVAIIIFVTALGITVPLVIEKLFKGIGFFRTFILGGRTVKS